MVPTQQLKKGPIVALCCTRAVSKQLAAPRARVSPTLPIPPEQRQEGQESRRNVRRLVEGARLQEASPRLRSGSTASCTAPTMNLRARWVRAAVRAGRRIEGGAPPLCARRLVAHRLLEGDLRRGIILCVMRL